MSKDPGYDRARMTDHYWSRPLSICANDSGYIAMLFGLSLRDKNDRWIDDIYTIKVYNNKGQLTHEVDSIYFDLVSMVLSPDGNYLIVNYGGMQTAGGQQIRNPGAMIFDLSSGRIIKTFNTQFNIPIFELDKGLLILSPDDNNNDNTYYYFYFKERYYKELILTSDQFQEVVRNWKIIRRFTNLLDRYPTKMIKF